MFIKISRLSNRQYSLGNIRNLCRKMASTSAIKVHLKQGVVVGRQNPLDDGGGIYNSFQGIPYAVPPLGELRYKSPVPLEKFHVDELDCTADRSVSHQRDPFTMEIVGSEDCLFLNVYAPQTKKDTALPVIVYIHGGGFWFGSGNSDYTLPKALMKEDVVVVTMNYRLGALGFLCFPEQGIWGNAGLKDQRLALQWVQDNIQNFNGDPSKVTIVGESAGAASVHLHTLAAHANQLFHKAIMQSGTANMEWVFQSNPSYKTKRLSQVLGCESNNPSEIIEFLRSPEVSPDRILASTLSVLTANERRLLPLPFKPVIEDSGSPDGFITEPVLDTLQRPDCLSLPTIIGYNSSEGMAMLVNAIRKLADYDRDLERYVPRNLEMTASETQSLAQRLREFYLQGRNLSPELYNEFVEMLSDFFFTLEAQKAAEMQVRLQPRAPLYFYRFDYVGKRNLYKQIFQMDKLRGASHGDELFYLFQMAGDTSDLHADDALMVRRLCRLWSNFARYSDPTPQGIEAPVIDCKWTAVEKPSHKAEPFELNYFVIDKECQMRKNPEKERIDFLKEIFSKYEHTDYSVYSRAKL